LLHYFEAAVELHAYKCWPSLQEYAPVAPYIRAIFFNCDPSYANALECVMLTNAFMWVRMKNLVPFRSCFVEDVRIRYDHHQATCSYDFEYFGRQPDAYNIVKQRAKGLDKIMGGAAEAFARVAPIAGPHVDSAATTQALAALAASAASRRDDPGDFFAKYAPPRPAVVRQKGNGTSGGTPLEPCPVTGAPGTTAVPALLEAATGTNACAAPAKAAREATVPAVNVVMETTGTVPAIAAAFTAAGGPAVDIPILAPAANVVGDAGMAP
jgi:hypothetical protein